MSEDGYWVYENWGHPEVTIHRSGCDRCKDGKGETRERETGPWLWHGRFSLLGSAWWFGENRTVPASRAREVRHCPRCLARIAAPPEMLRVPPEKS
jgi:hypothetical protein